MASQRAPRSSTVRTYSDLKLFKRDRRPTSEWITANSLRDSSAVLHLGLLHRQCCDFSVTVGGDKFRWFTCTPSIYEWYFE